MRSKLRYVEPYRRYMMEFRWSWSNVHKYRSWRWNEAVKRIASIQHQLGHNIETDSIYKFVYAYDAITNIDDCWYFPIYFYIRLDKCDIEKGVNPIYFHILGTQLVNHRSRCDHICHTYFGSLKMLNEWQCQPWLAMEQRPSLTCLIPILNV